MRNVLSLGTKWPPQSNTAWNDNNYTFHSSPLSGRWRGDEQGVTDSIVGSNIKFNVLTASINCNHGLVFETAPIKMFRAQTSWSKNRQGLLVGTDFSINTDKSCPVSPHTFIPWQVMHRSPRCASVFRTVGCIRVTGRGIIRSSLLSSLLRHSTRFFRTTEHVTSCVI